MAQLENVMPESMRLPAIQPQPSQTFRLTEKHVSGRIDRLRAMEQSILKRLATERYTYDIYPDYGTELEQYIGQSLGFLQASIQRTISESLLRDDRITSVSVHTIKQIAIDAVHLIIDVETTEGNITNMEIPLNV